MEHKCFILFSYRRFPFKLISFFLFRHKCFLYLFIEMLIYFFTYFDYCWYFCSYVLLLVLIINYWRLCCIFEMLVLNCICFYRFNDRIGNYSNIHIVFRFAVNRRIRPNQMLISNIMINIKVFLFFVIFYCTCWWII